MSELPPIIVLKERQVMMKLISKDFSFIGEQHVGELYNLFEKLHIKPNLTQNGAISFVAVLDDWPEKIEKLALEASAIMEVEVRKGLSLITVRHYTDKVYEKLTEGKTILLRQQTPETIQLLVSE